MAAAKRGNSARKSHAAQARRSAAGRKGRGAVRHVTHEEEEDELAYAGSAASFARAGQRTAQALQSDFALPVGEGIEQMMRGWMGFFQRAALSQQRLVQDMLELGSGRRIFEAQRAFVDESLRNFTDSTKEVLRASGRMAEPAVRTAERAAGLAQAYEDHDRAQRHEFGNGRSGFGGRRAQHEARR